MADVIPSFLPLTFQCASGRTFERETAMTDYRECHDSSIKEARILFSCREVDSDHDDSEAYVVKVKVQLPDPSTSDAKPGPSEGTNREIQALTAFRDRHLKEVPHLVGLGTMQQAGNGALPGGYITFIVMTKMPGVDLLSYKYWSIGFQERLEIQQRFTKALKSVAIAGITPCDRALRNILWEPETKQLSIVDFEIWEKPSAFAMDEEIELQRWGLAQRAPPQTWFEEWRRHHQ